MKYKHKKGFTLVELLVVMAILSILAVVTTTSYRSFTKKAHAANDISFVSQLNLLLKSEEVEKSVRTPEDALEVLQNNGYSVNDLVASVDDYQIAWNQKSNSFVLLEGNDLIFGEEAPNQFYYWKFLDNIEDTDFSIYLKGSNEYDEVNIKSGLDVGNNQIKQINYINSEQKEDVLILTSEEYITSLYIDGINDTITHYGYLIDLNIHAISDHTYFEFGKVLSSVNLDQGHFVGEDGSELPSSLDGDVDISKSVIWDTPTYYWDDNASKCVAIRKDLNHHVEDQIEEGIVTISKYVEATCDDNGEKVVEASFENKAFVKQQKVVSVPRHEHIVEIIPKVEPTCLKTGLSEGEKCAECGKILLEQEVLPISDHHYDENGVCVDCQSELVNKDWKDFDSEEKDEINSKKFEELIKDKEYVKLTSDINFKENVGGDEININTNKVINLNGHTIEMYRTLVGKSFFSCSGNSTITFMNGTLIGVGNDKANVVNTLVTCEKATVIFDNVSLVNKELSSTALEAKNGANITINKSNIVAHYAIKNSGASINIEQSHIGSDDRIVCSRALDFNSGNVTVNNSTFTGDNPIYNNKGMLVMKNTLINADDTAFEIETGETNLYNCEITGKKGIENTNASVSVYDSNINVSETALEVGNTWSTKYNARTNCYRCFIKGKTAIEVHINRTAYFNNCELYGKHEIHKIVNKEGKIVLENNCSVYGK